MFGLSPMEMMICGTIALLLFGSRLPEVARSLGKGMREFKEGVSGVTDEFHSAYSSTPSRSTSRANITHRPTPASDDEPDLIAPKFEPPPAPESSEPERQESTP